ncbi:hypothetical protein [Streptosporangium sp. NPDC049078]|uniref:hypothetical protein n=1 Tax=Streptosporangium sp. NPDC049078 TaxID=3155767 RepID=UPI00341595C8
MFNVTAVPPRCQPWCTDHYTGAHPDDSHCRRPASGQFADVYLSNGLDGTPMVLSYQRVHDELPLDEAAAYFRAGLDLVAAARTAVAA